MSQEDRPFNRLQTIAMEVEVRVGISPGTECGALMKLLYYLGSPRSLLLCSKEPEVAFYSRRPEIPFPDGNLINMRRWPDEYTPASADENREVYRSDLERSTRDNAIWFLQQQVIPGFQFPKVDEIPKVREGIYHYCPRYTMYPYVYVRPDVIQRPPPPRPPPLGQVPGVSTQVREGKIVFSLPRSIRRLGRGIRDFFESS